MIGTELLFLLILFVIRSASDCIGSVDATCSGHSFDSFTNIGEKCRAIHVNNPPEADFVVDKSKNQYLHMIDTLDFSSTKSLVISEYGFKDFVSLSSLDLELSSIEALKSTWFLPNNNITYFYCDNNDLRTLSKSDLENLKMVKYANFSYNLLESIEPHTFSEMEELRYLILSGNYLKSIPSGRLPMLSSIKLDKNLIDIIPANVFNEMPKIQGIYLQENAIRKIEDGAFKDLKYLNHVDLGNNFIEDITELTFSGTTLNWLNLSSNKISRIPPGVFKVMMPVHGCFIAIHFSNNSINELNENTFEGLDSNKLSLDLNEIVIIGNNTFRGFKHLEELDISNNKLRSLTANIFGTNLPILETFSVSNNSISHLDSDVFKFTVNIRNFAISSNKLQFLPDDIFVPLNKLERLYMQNNSIKELTEGHIESFKSLNMLSIEHNQLTFIPLNRDSFPNLNEMGISGNPWQCTCLHELQNFLNENNITFVKKYYFDWQCPVCVPTYFQHCEKNTDFARWKEIPETYSNSSFTEQCRIKYLMEMEEYMFQML